MIPASQGSLGKRESLRSPEQSHMAHIVYGGTVVVVEVTGENERKTVS